MSMPTEFGGRFSVVEQIEKRPNCTVFKARDKELGDMDVALKVFFDRPNGKEELIERFKQEMGLLANASHPNLVPIISSGVTDDYFYIALEYISGLTLRAQLKEKGAFKLNLGLSLFLPLCEAVAEFHNENIYHGHIDTRAIMLKGDKLVLAGYYPSVITAIQKELTSEGRFIIEPAYIAPEQLSGTPTPDSRADIYALAVILYEMLTGQRPFLAASPFQTAALRLTQAPVSPARIKTGIPPIIDAAIMKGLAKNPAERFASIKDFCSALSSNKKSFLSSVASSALNEAERLGTETIAVSVSTDSIKDILKKHDEIKTQGTAMSSSTDKTVIGAPLKAPSAGAADFGATVMGVPSAAVLCGGLAVMNGDNKGKRFPLEKQQVMIGADSGCDLCFKEKAVSPRQVIVVRRDNKYFAAPLSTAKLVINGKEQKGMDEVELKRGDIISVGSVSLRFIAPGEVFTFKEENVDRVIDRPISKTNKILAFVGILVVVVVLIFGYQFTEYQKSLKQKQRTQLQQENKEKQEVVAGLIREGDDLFKNGALLEPVGNCAQDRFQKVLDIDPDNSYAKRQLRVISDRSRAFDEERKRTEQHQQEIQRILGDGESYFRAGKLIFPPGENARAKFEQVVQIDPTNEQAQKRLKEIDRLINDVMQKVEELLARAEDYKRLGQYIEPSDANAYQLVQEVLKVDAQNQKAKNLIMEMAAMSVYQGDVAKAQLDKREMNRQYGTAEILGVDPQYLQGRRAGSDLIGRTASEIVIVSKGTVKQDGSASAKFLSSEELDKKIKALEVRLGVPSERSSKTLITIPGGD